MTMDSEDLYIRFSAEAPGSRNDARELQDYLATEAARAGVALSMSIEAAGQGSPRLKLSKGDHMQKVFEWVLRWLQENPSITVFAESLDGSSSVSLSQPQPGKGKGPWRLSDADFRSEFQTFNKWWES